MFHSLAVVIARLDRAMTYTPANIAEGNARTPGLLDAPLSRGTTSS
jgi:hypothetical protein